MGFVPNLSQSLIDNLEFITDLARYAEGLFTEQQVKKKHHFDDATWESLGSDEQLVEAIKQKKSGASVTAAPSERKRSSTL
jgi:hypothetical protein